MHTKFRIYNKKWCGYSKKNDEARCSKNDNIVGKNKFNIHNIRTSLLSTKFKICTKYKHVDIVDIYNHKIN